jgi:hypothetical protein
MTTMNAKAELENRRLEPSHSISNSTTMDVAAEVLQSLGDDQQQQADGGEAVKEESVPPPPKKADDKEGSAEAAADSEPAEVKSPEEEAPPPKDAADNGEREQQLQAEAPKGEDLGKRYLPEHKKPDAAPTFPEKVGTTNRDVCATAIVRTIATVDIWFELDILSRSFLPRVPSALLCWSLSP